jgi:penicillin V acylase-like amidase (Ntn superfamily)
VIEFLGGQLVARSERTLPLPVLTNDTYAASLEYLNRTLGYGGEPVEPTGFGSLARFARAADGTHRARRSSDTEGVESAFAILADVADPERTQWRLVYELQSARVHFASSGNPAVRSVDLGELDLDCTAEAVVLDLAAEGSGDVTGSLVPYTTDANRALVEAGFTAAKATKPTADTMERLVTYADRLRCTFEATE